MKVLTYVALFLTAALLGAAVMLAAAPQRHPTAPPPPTPNTENPYVKTTTTHAPAAPSAPVYSKSGHDITPLSPSRIDQLAQKLTPEERNIVLAKGTEPAFCGTLLDNKKDGTYICRLCGLPLFASDAKFNSGTGWPSFFRPVDPAHVREERDTTYGMVRVETLCARCGAHLGHVFDDAPQTPTGLRFCMNSASLDFVEKGQPFPPQSRPIATQTAYFAGGCFWGVEDQLQHTPGVIDAVSGYMGGRTANPTYKQVCAGDTGHAETVKVVYDPARITYRQLLDFFFKFHDPTQVNRQGPDIGDQYRSAIFAATPEHAAEARAFIEQQQSSNPRFATRKIATQVVTADASTPFYEAEDYHQDYHLKHGGSCALPAN